MRFFKFATVSLVMIFFLMLGIAVSDAYAGNYLGEFCWQTEDGDIVKLAVTDMGNGHYLLNGRMIDPVNETTQACYGSAEIVADKVYMILTTGGSYPTETFFCTGSGILDLGTLNGYGESLNIFYDKDTQQTSITYDTVTLTFIPCPE